MSLGIYFGPKSISVVETKGKKLSKHAQVFQTLVPAGELEEKVSFEAKMIEMVALFKDELRRNKIESKDVSLCLSGNDLIIRTFEIPQLPKEELASAINFEAKKYIPFKVEDLITDFQVEFDKVNRTNLVLFMGIKKETLERYLNLMNQLNLKVGAIEYSAFSALRSLKQLNLSDDGVIGTVDADLLSQDEVNFTVLENGFPLFSRDIALSSGPGDLEAGPRDTGMALEKLKTEIRISLDYYNRKFPTKNIKKLYLICNDDVRSELEAFISQIGPTAQFVDVARSIEGAPPFSLGFLKAFCVSLGKIVKTDIRCNLLTVKEKAAPAARERAVALEAEPMKMDFKMVILGLLICGATYGYGIYRMNPVKLELQDTIGKRPAVTMVNPEASLEELSGKESEFKKKLETLNDLIKKQLYVTKPLSAIPKAIPEGAWLTRFTFEKKDKGADLTLDGMSYLANSDEEMKTVNQFVQNLKSNPEFAKFFKNINVTSIDRRQMGKITATSFLISCKTY